MNDDKCQSYSYSGKYFKCYLYTTTPCQKECTTINMGKIGLAVHQDQKNFDGSGCYVKKRRKKESNNISINSKLVYSAT